MANCTLAKFALSSLFMLSSNSFAMNAEDHMCVLDSSGKYAACIRENINVYVGVLKRLSDNETLGTVGEPIGPYVNGLECLNPRFEKTKFGEELALFDCVYKSKNQAIYDFGINRCGIVRKPGYLEEQNGSIPPKLTPSTRFKLEYEIVGTSHNEIHLKNGGIIIRIKTRKPILEAHYIEYARIPGERLESYFVQVTLIDNSVQYFGGAFEYFYSPNGYMTANKDFLCLNP